MNQKELKACRINMNTCGIDVFLQDGMCGKEKKELKFSELSVIMNHTGKIPPKGRFLK